MSQFLPGTTAATSMSIWVSSDGSPVKITGLVRLRADDGDIIIDIPANATRAQLEKFKSDFERVVLNGQPSGITILDAPFNPE